MGESTENNGKITEKRKGQPENLKPWPKGISGNPGGRPRGIFGKEALRQLRKRAENGETALEEIIAAQIEKAIRKRDTRSAELLRDTVDGRPSANDEARASIGQINIIWNGPAPAWATAQPSPIPPATNEPMPLPPWAKPAGDDTRDTTTEADDPSLVSNAPHPDSDSGS